MYCAAILDGLGAGERGGFLWRMCESRSLRAICLVPLVPDHEQDEPTPTQEASAGPKLPSFSAEALVLTLHVDPRSSSPCSSRRATQRVPCQPALRNGLAPLQRRASATACLGSGRSRKRPLLQARHGGAVLGLHRARWAEVLTAQRHRILSRPARLGRGPQPRNRPRIRLVASHARVVRSVGRG